MPMGMAARRGYADPSHGGTCVTVANASLPTPMREAPPQARLRVTGRLGETAPRERGHTNAAGEAPEAA